MTAHRLAPRGPYPPETVIADPELGAIYRIEGMTLALLHNGSWVPMVSRKPTRDRLGLPLLADGGSAVLG